MHPPPLLLQVILVGEYGVGKSSLFRRFASDTFVSASDRQSTLGLDNFGRVYSVGGEGDKDGGGTQVQNDFPTFVLENQNIF